MLPTRSNVSTRICSELSVIPGNMIGFDSKCSLFDSTWGSDYSETYCSEMPSSNANFLVKMVAFLLVEGGQYELERELNILSKSSSSWSILKCDWVPAPAHEIWTSSWTCVHWLRSSNTLDYRLDLDKTHQLYAFQEWHARIPIQESQRGFFCHNQNSD